MAISTKPSPHVKLTYQADEESWVLLYHLVSRTDNTKKALLKILGSLETSSLGSIFFRSGSTKCGLKNVLYTNGAEELKLSLRQESFYQTKKEKRGIRLDSRNDMAKSDWQLMAAAAHYENAAVRNALIGESARHRFLPSF